MDYYHQTFLFEEKKTRTICCLGISGFNVLILPIPFGALLSSLRPVLQLSWAFKILKNLC
jgi:hypothetical protein